MKGTLLFFGDGQDNYAVFNHFVEDLWFIHVDVYCSLQALRALDYLVLLLLQHEVAVLLSHFVHDIWTGASEHQHF